MRVFVTPRLPGASSRPTAPRARTHGAAVHARTLMAGAAVTSLLRAPRGEQMLHCASPDVHHGTAWHGSAEVISPAGLTDEMSSLDGTGPMRAAPDQARGTATALEALHHRRDSSCTQLAGQHSLPELGWRTAGCDALGNIVELTASSQQSPGRTRPAPKAGTGQAVAMSKTGTER